MSRGSASLIPMLVRRLTVLTLIAVTASTACGQTFELSVRTQTESTSKAGGSPSQVARSADNAKSSSIGTEQSQCQPYGRNSTSTADASISVGPKKPNAVQLALATFADARGGHYRTCSLCAVNECVGVRGYDTDANATSSAAAEVEIAFGSETLPGRYRITVGRAASLQGAVSTLVLSDPEGKETPVSGQPMEVQGRPGAVYTVRAQVKSSAANEGGCCSEEKRGNLSFGVSVERAAEIQASTVPYILRGTNVTGYLPVGLLALKSLEGTWSPHCTATLVAGNAVLTSAHCVSDDFAPAVAEGRMKFVSGTAIDSPSAQWTTVSKAEVPDGSGSGSFRYRKVVIDGKTTTVDDVAVVTLSQALTTAPYPLYRGDPALAGLMDSKEALFMVGFGLYTVTGALGNDGAVGGDGAGKKRQATLPIDSLAERTFGYHSNAQGQATCQGDSGGPALLDRDGSYQVVGITAYGSDNCSSGRSMRVDIYAPWIQSRF